MKQFTLTNILIFILVFPVWAEAADVRAFVDRTHAAMGESVNLTVTVSGDQGDVDLSPIRDFKVVSRGSTTSVRIVNGRMSREASFNYILIPLREGRLLIPPLKVVSAGKPFKTQAIIVNVSKQPQADTGRKDLFVQSQVSEQNPFEGQQVTYTFRLFTAVRLANAKFQKPDFSGFTAKEAGDTKTYQKIVNGKQFTVSEVSYVLVPLKPGRLTIEPGTFRCDIIRNRQRGRRQFFDSFFDDSFFGQAELVPKIFSTKAFTIDVKPLPASKGDVQFSGLVGRFEIKAELEKTEISVGDSTTLAVTIAGSGNIMDALPPEVTVADGFKVYADNPEEDIIVDKTGFSGQKVFRTALVAVKPGIYTVGPVQISYFDVSKQDYVTLSTRLFSVTANPSAEAEKVEIFSTPGAQEQLRFKKKSVEFVGRDILPLKEELDALKNHRSINMFGFIILLSAPILFYSMVLIALKFSQKRKDPASIMAQRAENALKRARKIKDSREEFLTCLYRSLVAAIFATTGAKGESLTHLEAEEILGRSGYSEKIIMQSIELLKKIESARYGGLTLDGTFKSTILTETKNLVRRLLR
jgi:hypothetical protein